jgi:hypothetical protein
LWFIEVADTLGAAVMCNDINVVAHALAIAHVIAFILGVTPGFEDCFVWTFRQACPARDTFIRNQQCHDPRLLLTPKVSQTILTTSRRPDHSA